MTMEDWSKRLDLFLMADDREVLQDAGKITAEIAKAKAETEFEKYRVIQDRLFTVSYTHLDVYKRQDVRCKVLLGVELTDFEIININECEQQEDSDNDKYSGELVPIIARDAFENEATKFLEKYYPLALQEPVAVPIRKIADDMGLSIIEDSLLSSELDIFGLVVFEDGNIKDKNKNIVCLLYTSRCV